MKLYTISKSGWASNSYLVLDDKRECAVLVDPCVSGERLSQMYGKALSVSAIILTHGHFDHMLALAEWQSAGVPVFIGKGDAAALSDPHLNCSLALLDEAMSFAPPDRLLFDGDTISLGEEKITVLSVPGHTAGGICLSWGDVLLCGDTLFANGGI
ncbi:MAG: MBL fold metallo-hydrolase, partial [Clostridia bacterium]|nr:MBL fold metallo-hydrolase [Clostridia bacterium]